MTRDEAEKILFDGTTEEIMLLRCPDCGGVFSYDYREGTANTRSSMTVTCNCLISRMTGLHYEPNCVKRFGEKARIDENLKLKKSA